MGVGDQKESNDEIIAINKNKRIGYIIGEIFRSICEWNKNNRITKITSKRIDGAATIVDPRILLARGRLVIGNKKTSKNQTI